MDLMHNWMERQQMLKAYERKMSDMSSARLSLESSCARLDELRELSRRLGKATIDTEWWKAHEVAHAQVRKAMAAITRNKQQDTP